MVRTDIKNFNLFGEVAGLPDVVHCETIEERSVLHNWEFHLHRHTRLHQILLISTGGGRAELDGKQQTLNANTIVNVPVNVVHGFSFFEGTHGWVITLGEEILDESLKETEGVRQVFSQAKTFDCPRKLTEIIQDIAVEYAGRNFARAHILRSLAGLLIGRVSRVLLAHGEAPTPELHLKQRFDELVDQHFEQHWQVRDYARALSVTSGHLSRVTRAATGLPATRLIEGRIMREARRYLAYTNLTVAEIAYTLGYIDPAYFSRVFARSTGVSPREFRAKLG